MDSLRFALDIGTRGVTGVLYRQMGGICEIVHVHSLEHADRAMQDGQIHDIQAVARVITQVKRSLEERVGATLTKVAAAAAGRALQTVEATATTQLSGSPCSETDVYNLQLLAVQSAMEKLNQSTAGAVCHTSGAALHCVGYSVRTYELDNSLIGSLVGQRGQQASVTLIATFLPRVVIDSLDAALTEAGIVMQGLTLEPIAAINALIPASMRKLNIVLVDIGAGTSDIAITADGTVLAYGMVPIAGDEITEALSEHLLLDFTTAERLKRELGTASRHTFQDVLGNPLNMTTKKILGLIRPAIETLAGAIAREILRLNGKAPAAVMVIGGGAKTPLIEQLLAESLELATDRVRMRGRESLQNVRGCEEDLFGPEAITPIGIALAASYSEITPLTVTVDGQSTRLFAFYPLTVGDALMEAGVDLQQLKGRPGAALVVEVNGQIHSLPGTMGTPGSLLCNGMSALLTDKVHAGDVLQIQRAINGQDAKGVIADVIPDSEQITMYINEHAHQIPLTVRLNGKPAHSRSRIRDRDVIALDSMTTYEAIERCLNISLQETVSLSVNGKSVVLYQKLYHVIPEIDSKSTVKSGLAFTVKGLFPSPLTVKHALDATAHVISPRVDVLVNGKLCSFSGDATLRKNGHNCSPDTEVHSGDVIELAQGAIGGGEQPLTMGTIMLHLETTLRTQAAGTGRLIMRKNGETADLLTLVQAKDEVEIYWEQA